MGGVLDLTVGRNQPAAEFGQPRATAPRSTDARRADGLYQNVIEVVEQQPGAPIAHPELASRLRKRAARLDTLEQGDFPRADRAAGSEIDPQPHTERVAALIHAADGSATRKVPDCGPRGYSALYSPRHNDKAPPDGGLA
jgi:hypothetical protein